jgi:hypothetical protein
MVQRNLIKNVSVSPNDYISGNIVIDINGTNITLTCTCSFIAQVVNPVFTAGTTNGGTDVAPSTPLIYNPLISVGNYTYVGVYTGTLSGGQESGFTVNSVIVSYQGSTDVANLGEPSFFACFLQGTLVETPYGSVAIEYLRAGDLVISQSGDEVPIRKTGNWFVDFKTRSTNAIVYKIPCGSNRVKEDVYISYHHKIQVRGKFIKAHKMRLEEATMDEIGSEYNLYNIELYNHRKNCFIVGGGLIVESWNGINPSSESIEFLFNKLNPSSILSR